MAICYTKAQICSIYIRVQDLFLSDCIDWGVFCQNNVIAAYRGLKHTHAEYAGFQTKRTQHDLNSTWWRKLILLANHDVRWAGFVKL